MTDLLDADLGFVTGAAFERPLRLLGARGVEEISQPFSYDLLLARDEPLSDDEIERLLDAPAALALGGQPGEVVHGVLDQVTAVDTDDSATSRYVARMVPTVSLFSLGRASRVYANTTAAGLVHEVLGRYGLVVPEHGRQGDYRVACADHAVLREYVVQYDESDFAFLQRWLEHEGLSYWFEHEVHGEVIVVSDDTRTGPFLSGSPTLRYRGRNNLDPGKKGLVWGLDFAQRRVPARVVVADYNEDNPALLLRAEAAVEGGPGFGTALLYGEDFRDVEAGQALAAVRAEALACRRRVCEGRSDSARLRAGQAFRLEGHPGERDGDYLVTAVSWHVGFPVDDPRGTSGANPRPFEARFSAIPRATRFRPERRAPWPSIAGVVPAHIASSGSDTYADLDDKGRYLVALPFVASSKDGGAVSRRIRMATLHAGQNHGVHFPLRKGAEVLLVHLDGDPDRPVIVGVVPNALTASPVTTKNATQSVIRSASGIQIELNDLAGGVR